MESSSFLWKIWVLFTFSKGLDPSVTIAFIWRIWEIFYMLPAALQVILVAGVVTIPSSIVKVNSEWFTRQKCYNIYGFKITMSVILITKPPCCYNNWTKLRLLLKVKKGAMLAQGLNVILFFQGSPIVRVSLSWSLPRPASELLWETLSS